MVEFEGGWILTGLIFRAFFRREGMWECGYFAFLWHDSLRIIIIGSYRVFFIYYDL